MKVEVTYWCRAPLRPGDVVDLPDAVAEQLIKDKHAKLPEPQDSDEAAERAGHKAGSGDQAESAGKRSRRGRLPVPAKPKPGDDEPVPDVE